MPDKRLVVEEGKSPALCIVDGGQRGMHGVPADAREAKAWSPESFLGGSPPAREVRELLWRLTAVPMSALIISGETGTGKGLAARILHHTGPRSDGPLIEVNCAALPRDLAESELFGHEAGSFTGARGRHRGYLEQADGGTLFLDEIGELDMDLQAKLLTAIEDHCVRRVGGETSFDVDVQIIAASNRRLERQVREQRFRSDLFHRLSVFHIVLPPLRQRIEDLPQLVPFIVEEISQRAGRPALRIGDSVYRALSRYHWPGNIRELRNVLEQAALHAESDRLDTAHMEAVLRLSGLAPIQPAPPAAAPPPDDEATLLQPMAEQVRALERRAIAAALRATGGNKLAAARRLGISRATLYERLAAG